MVKYMEIRCIKYRTVVCCILAIVSIHMVPAVSINAKSLVKMAREDNLAGVTKKVSKGDNLNLIEDGHSALYVAAEQGYADIAGVLLKAGADPNLTESFTVGGKTGQMWGASLLVAADNGHADIVQLLLDSGAKPDGLGLFLAAMKGHDAVVSLFLKAGVAPDERLFTAVVAKGGHCECGRLLVTAGLDVKSASKDGWTPLLFASLKGCNELVREIIDRGADINATKGDGETALSIAAMKGNGDIVKTLVDHGANVNAVDSEGYTALMWSAINNDTASAILLATHGASVNVSDEGGLTPLHHAAMNNQVAFADSLVSLGATIDPIDAEDNTPLHYAAQNNCLGIAELLLSHGANANAVNSRVFTAFFNTTTTTKDGSTRKSRESSVKKPAYTPLDLAKQKNHLQMIDLLQKHGGHGSGN